MSLDASSLVASLFVSSVGFVLLSYGRKMSRVPHGLAGIILLVFPYFVESVVVMLALAVLILAALWLAARLGW